MSFILHFLFVIQFHLVALKPLLLFSVALQLIQYLWLLWSIFDGLAFVLCCPVIGGGFFGKSHPPLRNQLNNFRFSPYNSLIVSARGWLSLVIIPSVSNKGVANNTTALPSLYGL